ncbi:MAG: peptidyl-prolyl cis-trans isomerase [Rhodospirillales bacterium]|nr:peptidyl-prolyl cis-trans isomerase [Rhodospirillales bacterium]
MRDTLADGADPLLLGQVPTPYPRQSPDQIRDAYGADFLAKLQTLTAGDWAVIHVGDVWHVVGLTALTPEKQSDFAAFQDVIGDDWQREQQLRLAARMIRAMRANYEVRRGSSG